jgi:hypothetical protein
MTIDTATQILSIDRESFLLELNRHQVAVHNLDSDELISKIQTGNDKAISQVRDIVRKAKMHNQGRTPHFWVRSDMVDLIQQIIKII